MRPKHKALHILINIKVLKRGISKELYKSNLKLLKAAL